MCLISHKNCLPLASLFLQPQVLLESMLFLFLVFCAMFCVSLFCIVCPNDPLQIKRWIFRSVQPVRDDECIKCVARLQPRSNVVLFECVSK
jgi:hypothetical protein